jgi:hypothetical protein
MLVIQSHFKQALIETSAAGRELLILGRQKYRKVSTVRKLIFKAKLLHFVLLCMRTAGTHHSPSRQENILATSTLNSTMLPGK